LAKSTKKLEKAHIAAGVVQQIRQMEPSGRFLKEDGDTGMWWDIGDAKAIKKVGQALREDAPDIREEIGVDEDGNEIEISGGGSENGDKKKDKSVTSGSGGDKKSFAKKGPACKSDKSSQGGSVGAKKHVIVLPTTRPGKRGEDNSPGALPPQKQAQHLLLMQQQQQQQQAMMSGNGSLASSQGYGGDYQQVLPPGSGASITQVSLPSMGPPQQQTSAGMMYPPSTSSNSSATLRHGQFSRQPAMSQKAMEMMSQQIMMNNAAAGGVFGMNFNPPSEMSLGSHNSSVSGLSGFTNSAASALMNQSLLSGVSDGVSSLTAGDASYRMQMVAAAQRGFPMDNQQLAALNAMNAANNNAAVMNNLNNMNAAAAAANGSNNSMGPPAVGMFQNRNNNGNNNNNNHMAAPNGNGSVYSGSRGSNGFNNYTLTSGSGACGSALGGSDLSGQTMPQAAPIFGRTSSHNDLSSLMVRDDLSMANHSLLGGGIQANGNNNNSNDANNFRQLNQQYQMHQQQQMLLQQQKQQQLHNQQQQQQQQQVQHSHRQPHQQQVQFNDDLDQHEPLNHNDGMDASFMSGQSLASFNRGGPPRANNAFNYKDGMDFSVFSGASLSNSVANRSTTRNPGVRHASHRNHRSGASVADRSHTSNYSISAMSQSIASMSIHSGASVASFSA